MRLFPGRNPVQSFVSLHRVAPRIRGKPQQSARWLGRPRCMGCNGVWGWPNIVHSEVCASDCPSHQLFAQPSGLWQAGCRQPLRHEAFDKSVEAPPILKLFDPARPELLQIHEIWAILHDGLELDVPVAALPAGDEVEHVRAVGGAAVLPALGAGERDAERGEHGEVRDLVPHAEEAREEVDLARDGRDGQEAGGADDEQGEYCLVGEVGVDVGRLLSQDDDVPPRSPWWWKPAARGGLLKRFEPGSGCCPT